MNPPVLGPVVFWFNYFIYSFTNNNSTVHFLEKKMSPEVDFNVDENETVNMEQGWIFSRRNSGVLADSCG